MKTSLIISTYNWIEALNLVLKSALNQSVLPDEIIIADDGSNQETADLIQKYQEKSPVEITHTWQKDDGFRKAEVLNKAIVKAKYDYIIQVDGDCIMHPHFIKDHLASASPNTYLFGARVNIQEAKLNSLFEKEQVEFSIFEADIKKKMRGLHLPFLKNKEQRKPKVSSKFRGCNCSYWKKDALEINGYNEDFKGWGREDSDFIIRLHNKGVYGKRLKFNGIVYHIYHLEKSKNNLEQNDSIEQKTIQEKIVKCKNGIDKL